MSDNPIHVAKIAREIKLQPSQVRAVRALLADDSTVPFIARYRKEATGSLDEVQITAIRDRLEQLEELDQRREAIIKSLGERSLLTEELGKKLAAAETMTVLEDIYLQRNAPGLSWFGRFVRRKLSQSRPSSTGPVICRISWL